MPDICPNFAESLINKDGSYRVLGRRLRPYSLWHLTLLQIFKSPLLSGEEIPPLEMASALERAVRICRCKYPKVPSMKIGWWTEFRWPKPHLIPAEVLTFSTYLRDYNAPPEFWETEGQASSNLGQPPATASAAARLMLLGKDENKAWDTPTGIAFWMASVYSVVKGSPLDFITPLSPEIEAELKEAQRLLDEGKLQQGVPKGGEDQDGLPVTPVEGPTPCRKCGVPHPEEINCAEVYQEKFPEEEEAEREGDGDEPDPGAVDTPPNT